jgi:toxin YoeB
MKTINWHFRAWEDYLYWQAHDKKILKRINALIKDILRNPFDGIGKPEPLKFKWKSGFIALCLAGNTEKAIIGWQAIRQHHFL